ncbi:MAG: hypothetical protein Athens071426_373 [Parcubacteria group bacterium Athens0714_26]|nr:MAG: hypothetical protein Athens071426_373 [Parcubacteria group bacterium Athens0714_26]
MPRVLKQIIYGIFYLLIVSAISFGVYWFFGRPAETCLDNIQNQNEIGVDCGGLCVSCELKNIKPLSVSDTDIFKYKINFYDFNGKLIESINRSSFIYAGENKNMVEAGIDVGSAKISRAEVVVADTRWILSGEFQPPAFETNNLRTGKTGDTFIVSGVIKNVNSFSIARIIINAVLVNKAGSALGATRTEIDDLNAFSERNFSVFAQVDPFLINQVDASNTQFFIEARRDKASE